MERIRVNLKIFLSCLILSFEGERLFELLVCDGLEKRIVKEVNILYEFITTSNDKINNTINKQKSPNILLVYI